jgi:uncharacterized Zn finger protein
MNPVDAVRCSDCGAGLDDTTVQHVEERDAHPAVPVDALACPACGVVMQAGDVSIRFPVLLWNWNAVWMKLVFRLRGRREETRVMDYGQTRAAARCPGCGGVWIGARTAARTRA